MEKELIEKYDSLQQSEKAKINNLIIDLFDNNSLKVKDSKSLYGIFAGQIIMEDNFNDELEEFSEYM